MILNRDDPWKEVRLMLVAHRMKLGINQRVTARKMGTSQSHFSDLETGIVRLPTITTIMRWSQALGVDVHFFAEESRS